MFHAKIEKYKENHNPCNIECSFLYIRKLFFVVECRENAELYEAEQQTHFLTILICPEEIFPLQIVQHFSCNLNVTRQIYIKSTFLARSDKNALLMSICPPVCAISKSKKKNSLEDHCTENNQGFTSRFWDNSLRLRYHQLSGKILNR